MELAQHKRLTGDTTVQVYFCNPQSPWPRGTDERTNRFTLVFQDFGVREL